MSDVLCVGLSCMDVLMKDVDLNTPFVSESKTAGQITVGVGGDAANEAVILSRLGHDVKIMTGIADDGTGDFIKNYLLKNHVDMTPSVITEGGESAVNVIVIHYNGDRNFINSGVPEAADLEPDLAKITDVKVVSLASMFMPPFEDPEKVKKVAKKAKEAGAVTCLDVIVKEDSRLEEYKEALPYIDYVFPNREEAMQLTGKEELDDIAEVFLSYGVKNVLIKIGKDGCYVHNAEGSCVVSGYHVDNVVDTTGAGDNFAAGLISGILQGKDLKGAVRYACGVAAVAIQYQGACTGVQSREQVETILKKVLKKRCIEMENKTAFLVEPERFEIKETPMPVCGDDDVMIETKHMGICGSDVMFYQDPTVGGALDTKLPIVLGHEVAGVVVKTGKNVTKIRPGDRVALEPGVPCGKCSFCLSGKYNLCPDVDFMAAPPWKSAALHKYIAHPAAFTFKLPENMDTIEGAMIEPLAVGVHAAARAGVEPGKSVVILGAGCIGLMTLMACRSRGATDITVVDLFENRLEKAMELGASRVVNGREKDTIEEISKITDGLGMDFVFETAGSPATAKQVPYLLKAGGRAVMVGNVHGATQMDLFELNNKEADLLSVFRYRNIFPTAIASVASGTIPVKKVATNFFKFDQVNEAFACALKEKQTALKVVIDFD